MKPDNFGGFTLYRVFYGEQLVYLGRTKQPLQSRIRGHLFRKPMHRELFIEQISRIEYAQFQTEADMYLYEIYFINLWHPPLNRDDKASDDLTVRLPDVEWHLFETPLWEKWRKEIAENDAMDAEKRRHRQEVLLEDREMRRKRMTGLISEKEYWDFWEKEVQGVK